MSVRLSICVDGASARKSVEAAQLAEQFGLDLWIGSPRPSGTTADDAYVAVAAAAVAGITRHARIGLFLHLASEVSPLRIAEDVAITDHASNGRIELCLVPPRRGKAAWEDRARAMLGAGRHWTSFENRSVFATPAPTQPAIPRLVLGDERLAGVLGAGTARFGWPRSSVTAHGLPARNASITDLGTQSVEGWLGGDPVAGVAALRDAADRHGHGEMIMLLPVEAELAEDVAALGIVVATGLRCSRHQLEPLVEDAWEWFAHGRAFHSAPGAARLV